MHGELPCLGSRIQEGEMKDHFKFMSYKEVQTRVASFGSGLCGMGLVPEGADFMSCVGIFAPSCSDWVIAEQACSAYGLVVVPLYHTFGPNAIVHVLNQVCSSLLQ